MRSAVAYLAYRSSSFAENSCEHPFLAIYPHGIADVLAAAARHLISGVLASSGDCKWSCDPAMSGDPLDAVGQGHAWYGYNLVSGAVDVCSYHIICTIRSPFLSFTVLCYCLRDMKRRHCVKIPYDVSYTFTSIGSGFGIKTMKPRVANIIANE